MSMSVGSSSGGYQSNINITPMIDVLLVLLILFLIIQPALTKGIDVQVPAIESGPAGGAAPDQIILNVRDEGGEVTYAINDLEVAPGTLEERLSEVFGTRARKVLFVRGDESLVYGDVVRAMDVARASGIEVIGLVPRRRSASPAR